MDLPLFASRSMSAFYIDLLGQHHWLSKWQKVTAGSSAEAEMHVTDECAKFLLEHIHILEFLDVKHNLCLILTSFIMIIRPVWTGQNDVPRKAYATFKWRRTKAEKI
jgi:hypothetical protein